MLAGALHAQRREDVEALPHWVAWIASRQIESWLWLIFGRTSGRPGLVPVRPDLGLARLPGLVGGRGRSAAAWYQSHEAVVAWSRARPAGWSRRRSRPPRAEESGSAASVQAQTTSHGLSWNEGDSDWIGRRGSCCSDKREATRDDPAGARCDGGALRRGLSASPGAKRCVHRPHRLRPGLRLPRPALRETAAGSRAPRRRPNRARAAPLLHQRRRFLSRSHAAPRRRAPAPPRPREAAPAAPVERADVEGAPQEHLILAPLASVQGHDGDYDSV